MIICPNCGNENKDDARFCASCGKTIPRGEDANAEEQDPYVNSVINGKFKITGVLGEGGMGKVYRGVQTSMGRPVAIKILHKHLTAQDRTIAERFKREARSAGALESPNAIQIFDFGVSETDGSLFMAMEFLRGRDLSKAIREDTFNSARVAHIISQVLSVLGEAHDKHIIHRDMKPENIYLVQKGEDRDFVKVLDFGIAKLTDPDSRAGPALTMAGTVCGTPEYMSPEQAMGHDLDARTDLYAVGVIMYEMLTGSVPFTGKNYQQILAQHIQVPATPPIKKRPDLNINPSLSAIAMKAMAKKRDERYKDAREMRADIERAIREIKENESAATVMVNAMSGPSAQGIPMGGGYGQPGPTSGGMVHGGLPPTMAGAPGMPGGMPYDPRLTGGAMPHGGLPPTMAGAPGMPGGMPYDPRLTGGAMPYGGTAAGMIPSGYPGGDPRLAAMAGPGGYPTPVPTPAPRSNAALIIALIAVIAILAVGGGVGAWWLTRPASGAGDTGEPTRGAHAGEQAPPTKTPTKPSGGGSGATGAGSGTAGNGANTTNIATGDAGIAGGTDRAFPIYDEKKDPNQAVASQAIQECNAKMAAKEFDQAVAACFQAVQAAPRLPRPWLLLAMVHRTRQKNAAACETYAEAEKLRILGGTAVNQAEARNIETWRKQNCR